MSQFHERLKKLRAVSGKKQKEIASTLELTPQVVSYYFNGREVPYDILIKMADFFQVSIDYLLGRTDIQSPDISAQGICEKTGLTELALQHLSALHDGPELAFMNRLLEKRDALEQIAGYVFQYLKSPDQETADRLLFLSQKCFVGFVEGARQGIQI